jgi:hypothetical protein
VDKLAERLAGRPPDDPVEPTRRREEVLDVAAPDRIGAAHHAKALLLEGSIEQPYPRKEAQD